MWRYSTAKYLYVFKVFKSSTSLHHFLPHIVFTYFTLQLIILEQNRIFTRHWYTLVNKVYIVYIVFNLKISIS